MLNKNTLEYLKDQFKTEFKFEEINKLNLTYELLENIGDKDSHLRDDIIYPCLARLLHDNHLEKDELVKITRILISDEYLSYDMENTIEFSTLRRTFTSLQLVILIYVHNRDKIWDKELVEEVFKEILGYYKNEEDLRGYVDTVGWIHSIAHSADMFAQLVKCEELNVKGFELMLEAISDKFQTDTYTYVSDEDERTVNAIFNLLERDIISTEFMTTWVNKLGEYSRPKTYPEVYIKNTNVKHLLRSLYFRVLDNEKYTYLITEIKNVLNEKVKLR